MRKVLLLIDYQKGFKSDCSKATVPAIEKLAKRGGWDDIIQRTVHTISTHASRTDWFDYFTETP